MEEIMRKYIRYVLNEKPFDPNLVANLIQLRKASGLEDYQVAGVLNEISRRTVKEKGKEQLPSCYLFFCSYAPKGML